MLVAVLLIALMLGGAGCTEPAPPPSSAISPPAPGSVSFSEVTIQAGLDGFKHATGAFGKKWMPETTGAGAGFVDYDGDGRLDILLVGGSGWPGRATAMPPALWLYRNNGDPGSSPGQAPTFSLKTKAAGLSGVSAYGFGITAADYDNDDDQDVFLTTLHENMLFRNDDGVFAEVGQQAGVAGASTWSTAALFFDADRDGWLDLYVGGYVEWSPEKDVHCSFDGQTKTYCTPDVYEGVAGRFYHNNGDGTFADASEAAGFLPAPGKTLGAATLDYNRDGWPDLVVANDLQRNLLYENDGDGTFTEKGLSSGIAFDENGRARAGMGVDVGIVDSSGYPSIFVGNFSNEMIGVYRHTGSGLFVDRAALSQVGQPSLLTLTFGLFLFDAELDGDLDLFAANGHVQQEIESVREGVTFRQPPQLFLNQGDGTFDEMKPGEGSPLRQPLLARGAAYGDVDRDGDLDLLITENGGGAHLWRNERRSHQASTASAHALRVALTGRQSNRDGIGGRVVAYVEGQRMERRVRTGASYLSQSEKAVTFGLGPARRADSLIVYWPSGHVDRFAGVQGDQAVRVTEGADTLTQRPFQQATPLSLP